MKIWNALKKVDWDDVVGRALWTFAQAFLAVFILAAEQIVNFIFAGDWRGAASLAVATMIAGISAGLSAVKTIVIEVIDIIKYEGVEK